MEALPTNIDPGDSTFQSNSAYHRRLAQELRERHEQVRQGGGEKYRQRQEAQGKLFVRDRIERLLDPGSPFLELSTLAAWGMYSETSTGQEADSLAAPGAGIVTGIGRVSGRQVLIVANDATVKGGSYYPTTVKKHLRAQQIAEEN